MLDLIESHDMRIIQCKCATKNAKKISRYIKDADKLPMPFKVTPPHILNVVVVEGAGFSNGDWCVLCGVD